MRHKKYIQGGYGWRTIDENGGEPIGRVRLFRDPVTDTEAATRNYVNSKLDNLDGNAFTKGILSSSCLPAFIGELIKEEGSSSVILNNTGVIAGNYSKVQVDAKGRVVVGKLLENTDLPALPFSKFTEGKPTTASGYGITDSTLGTSGGTFTGDLKLDYNLTSSDQYTMVNKDQVETALEAASYNKVPVGGIIESTDGTTPTGFLKANGGVVSKTTYSDLYSVIGDRFSGKMVVGSGKPWEQQALFNDTDPGDLTWNNANKSLAGPLANSQAVVTKNRVYLLGGYNSPNAVSTVYTTTINSDGTINAWTTGTSLPVPLRNSQAVVTKNRVYLLGGVGSNNVVSTVYTAPINEDGTLGAWTTGTSLPGPLSYSQAVVTKNRVYLLGGYNASTPTSTVYTAPINEDGTLGTWTTGTNLPGPLGASQAVVTKNRVYLLGRGNTSTVYTAPINEDGTIGTWVTSNLFNVDRYATVVVATSKTVYVIGGISTDNIKRVDIYTVQPDGTLAYNKQTNDITCTVDFGSCFVVKNKIYYVLGFGGYSTQMANFTGGKNDYSEFYTGDIFTNLDPTKFKLPDLNKDPEVPIYSYIRYE